MTVLDNAANLAILGPRAQDSHKGTYGRLLVLAGSLGYAGAAILTGLGALRSGVGLLKIGCPHPIQTTVAAGHPCWMTLPLPATPRGGFDDALAPQLMHGLSEQEALAVGPGLGRGREIRFLVRTLLDDAPTQLSPMPALVLDADGLNAMAEFLVEEPHWRATAPLVLTPHPGEFARLSRQSLPEGEAVRAAAAVAFAKKHGGVLVLKGHGTIITDGETVYRNPTGNPGMAKGGSGDVLTGIIGSFLAQGMPPLAAARFAVFIHGLAGDLARDALGEIGMTAYDIAEFLPLAFQQIRQSSDE